MTAKRGNPRKSRLARLPTSFRIGRFKFEPTEDDWRRIEAAFPFLLPVDREEISRMARAFLMVAPFERRAPKVVDAKAWLVEAEKAANIFWNAMHKRPSTDEEDLAAAYARRFVERHIVHPLLPEGYEWEALLGIMTHVVAAFATAKGEFEKKVCTGFVEGEMWDDLVCRLTDFAEQRGYPVSASKGVDKSKNDMTSPFIGLVRELQNTFPKECRRHTASDMAIAEAIAASRRKRRRRKIKLAAGVS